MNGVFQIKKTHLLCQDFFSINLRSIGKEEKYFIAFQELNFNKIKKL